MGSRGGGLIKQLLTLGLINAQSTREPLEEAAVPSPSPRSHFQGSPRPVGGTPRALTTPCTSSWRAPSRESPTEVPKRGKWDQI